MGSDRRVRRVRPAAELPSGWRVGRQGPDLDEWLGDAGALAGRVPVLSYGSNVSPVKVLQFGTELPAVVLACRTVDLAAVWCRGRREHREPPDVPCTLAAMPGHRESHALTYCTPAQLDILDTVEGRHVGRYDLVRLTAGTVVREDGAVVADVLAYVGVGDQRRPLAGPDGRPVAVAAAPQHEADALVRQGRPALCPGPLGERR